jgi:coenzyme F420-reducing hydrogenase delta subunit/ferredoxin
MAALQSLHALRLWALALYRRLEQAFDRVFGASLNPLRHLGSLGFLLFWLLAISGIFVYILFDTSVVGAYRSIDQLSKGPWYEGGLLRSVHRYAADGFVLVMLGHLLREGLAGRYQGFRRVPWLTGVPLLLLAFVSAIGGFWLCWDQLGQFSALATAEWLDRLPLFGSPLTRNFLTAAAVSDRLFSLLVFVHIGVPLLLVFGLWFHIQRISRAAVFPPRPLAAATTLTLCVLALAAPVQSHGPADMAIVPAQLQIDWLLLFVHPLTYATSGETVWALLGVSLIVLLGLPFLPQPAPVPVATVDADNCNGCRRCFDDCPYQAVTMVAHPTRPARQLAQVNADLCASCGICAGACPSATPFRGIASLVSGIDMPTLTVDAMRRQLREGLAGLARGGPRIVLFGCRQGAAADRLAAPDVLCLNLLCAGQLPPSFIEYALRDGADAVLIAACEPAGCEFRLGSRWTLERIAGAREPHLRDSVPPDRVTVAFADAGEEASLARALDALRQRLRAMPPPPVDDRIAVHG